MAGLHSHPSHTCTLLNIALSHLRPARQQLDDPVSRTQRTETLKNIADCDFTEAHTRAIKSVRREMNSFRNTDQLLRGLPPRADERSQTLRLRYTPRASEWPVGKSPQNLLANAIIRYEDFDRSLRDNLERKLRERGYC